MNADDDLDEESAFSEWLIKFSEWQVAFMQWQAERSETVESE